MAESEDAKREKWRNMNRDEIDMKSDGNRRGGSVGGSKRGAEIYRPGFGLYPKSPRGEPEDNMSTNNSNLYSSANEKRNLDLPNEGTQNGPSHVQTRGGSGRRSGHSGKSRLGRPEKSDGRNHREIKDSAISKLSERLEEVSLRREDNQISVNNDSERTDIDGSRALQGNNDGVKKVKKPEQQIYIPKPIAQSMASKEAVNKIINHHKEELWTDDDSASYCAEDDSKAGNSQARGDRRKKPKKKKKGKRGEGCDKGEDTTMPNNKSAVDSFNRCGNQASNRNDSFGRHNNAGGGRADSSRSGNRTDTQSQQGNRSGLDNRMESSRSNNRAPSDTVNARLRQWQDGRSDSRADVSRRLGSDSNAMSKSMSEHPRGSRMEDNRHRLDDASLTQSWHADMPSSRNVRLGSEPRAGPPGSSSHDNGRSRDTRSVEPSSWNAEKVQAKPPSGRRGSGKDLVSYNSGSNSKQSRHKDDVPPRFRKKPPENGVKEPASVYGKDGHSSQTSGDKRRYIGTTSEETWDGSTVTFQGSLNSQSSLNDYSGQYHSLPTTSLPPPPISSHPMQSLPPLQPHDSWANTLPATHSRGRGRLRPEDIERERAVSKQLAQPGGLDSHSSSVESLVYASSRGDRGQDLSHSYVNQPLHSPGPSGRRPSGGSLQGERNSGGRRSPTGRLTPSNSGNTTPVNEPSPSQDCSKVVSPQKPPDLLEIIVPEISDWSEEVERSEQLQEVNSRFPSNSQSGVLSSSSQDWNEEVERAERLQGTACKLSTNTPFENVPKPYQDVKQEVQQQEHQGSQRSIGSIPLSDHFPVMHQDWCEEVERSERLEACAGSEAHTRSSSPVSRSGDNVQWKKPVPTSQWKKPRRRKKTKEKRGEYDGQVTA